MSSLKIEPIYFQNCKSTIVNDYKVVNYKGDVMFYGNFEDCTGYKNDFEKLQN